MKKNYSFEQLMEELSPTLQKLEEKRKVIKKEALKRALTWDSIILIIALAISFYIPLILLFAFALIITITLIIILSRSQPICADYKEQVISRLVKALVEQGKYDPNKGISQNTFNESKLFISPDRYDSEDLISGVIDKTSFCFAEVHAEERRVQSNGKTTTTHWVTIFKGFMFIADFHKDFVGQTIVARDSFLKLKRGRVKMENPEFERHFDVFSTDQIEARYILTPSMMERIVTLNNKLGGDIVLSFYNSNVMIAVNNSTNHFEAGIWRPINNTKVLLREYNLITSMISIVEELNLNTRIWSKE